MFFVILLLLAVVAIVVTSTVTDRRRRRVAGSYPQMHGHYTAADEAAALTRTLANRATAV